MPPDKELEDKQGVDGGKNIVGVASKNILKIEYE